MLANEIWTYWRRVHRRAFDDAKHILRLETGVRAMIAAAITVCAIAVIWYIGEPEIAHHEIVVRLSLIAVILLVFPFVYGWQFFTAPAKLDMGAQKAIASLTASRSDERQRKIKRKLHDFYAAVGPIIERPLPRDISESDFDKYVKETETWATNCADWIKRNIGPGARARFLDRTYIKAIRPTGAVNETHIIVLQNLARYSQNLLVIIEDGAWDCESKEME